MKINIKTILFLQMLHSFIDKNRLYPILTMVIDLNRSQMIAYVCCAVIYFWRNVNEQF